jgi:DNA-binding winged helix-turn-helix (wHTH) protein
MHQSARQIYEFGSFQLDRQERLLTREGASVPLTPKAFDLLLALVERHGRLVEKEELFKAVWPDTIVEESNLSSNIALIRKALGERENGLKFIETVPKRGYRFVAVVQEVKDKSAEHSEAAENSGRAKAQPGWLNSKASGDKKSFRVALVMSVILLAGMGFGLYKFVRQAPNKDADIEPRIVPFTSFPHNELDPSFSPDGNQIAFAWDGEQGDNYDIYVKQLGTDALLRLTTNSAAERNPVWSPDSRYIAFTRVSKESCVELYLMPSLGGPERKITECSVIAKNALSLPFSLSPTSWSPDGAWLAVAEKNLMEETTSIFLVAHETGEKRRLTAAPPGSIGDGFPAFSPDGKMIAFARNSGGISELYLVSVVGGEAQRLTFSNGSTNPVWISDGREILFSSNTGGKGGLWKIPAAGGEAERIRPGFVSRFARSRQASWLGLRLLGTQISGASN